MIDNELIEYLEADIKLIQDAAINLAQAAVSLNDLKGTIGHALASDITAAFYKTANVGILLKQALKLLIDGKDTDTSE